jgi:acyl-CoA thioester hydrolase
MYVHQFKKRVRYGETDQMGFLYYGNYAQYYEIGRVEMLRSLGITYKDLEEKFQTFMPVLHLECRYVRPARYDDLLTIETTLRKKPQKDIVFYMEIKNEDGKIVNGGRVRLCFMNRETSQVTMAPDILLSVLAPYFEA